MALSFVQRVSIPDNVMFRELEGEAVILDLESESYFGLDEIGTRMWTLFTECESIQSAYDKLLGEFDVDAETLRTDVEELLRELISRSLLTIHADPD